MKKCVFLWVTILVLALLYSPSHAALTPFYFVRGSNVADNGGTFLIPPFPYNGVTYSNSGNTGANVWSSEYTETFNGYGGASFTGTGGVDAGNTNVSVDNPYGNPWASGWTSMTYVGFTDATNTPGANVGQQFQATFTQQYYDPDPNPESITVTGLITNLDKIDFDILQTINGEAFTSYSVTGSVSVNENFVNPSSTNSTANIASLALNESTTELTSDPLEIKRGEISGPDAWGYYYDITTTLTINATVENYKLLSWAAEQYELGEDASFQIGTELSPITVTASIETVATPIPSSLLLLISGVAGISLIRRRHS